MRSDVELGHHVLGGRCSEFSRVKKGGYKPVFERDVSRAYELLPVVRGMAHT